MLISHYFTSPTGSSSFESQKMGPSISVTSPMSPGILRDAPQYLSGQLSVSFYHAKLSACQLIMLFVMIRILRAQFSVPVPVTPNVVHDPSLYYYYNHVNVSRLDIEKIDSAAHMYWHPL